MKRKMIIRSLPEAMKMLKEMNVLSEDEWTSNYRQSAKEAILSFLRSKMDENVSSHLAQTKRAASPTEEKRILSS